MKIELRIYINNFLSRHFKITWKTYGKNYKTSIKKKILKINLIHEKLESKNIAHPAGFILHRFRISLVTRKLREYFTLVRNICCTVKTGCEFSISSVICRIVNAHDVYFAFLILVSVQLYLTESCVKMYKCVLLICGKYI